MNTFTFMFILLAIAIVVTYPFVAYFDNPEPNSTPKKPVSPPPGFKNDNALINYDYSMGVPKSEIKRREAIGYYLKPCDKYGCVYPEIAGIPLDKCEEKVAEILKKREEEKLAQILATLEENERKEQNTKEEQL